MATKKKKKEQPNISLASVRNNELFALPAKRWGLPADGKWWVYYWGEQHPNHSITVKRGFKTEEEAEKWIKETLRR